MVQAQDPVKEVRFASPKRIKAGDSYLGAKRLYPSPAVYDVNRDGKLDVVIGDLWGKITIATQKAKNSALVLEREIKLPGVDGKQLDFGNW